MNNPNFESLGAELTDLLSLQNPPLAITFTHGAPQGVERFQAHMPEPTADGRTGRVPAGCVFWMKAQDRTFSTAAADHANCSVGSLTHGFKSLDEAADKADVAALVASGWVTPEMFPQIPVVRGGHTHVTYGPLAATPSAPDVVFLRLNAKQAMMLADAVPEIAFQGKPQCHIIAMAKEQDQVAVSVGCMLSRVRTGMPNTEMTCAIPAGRLQEVVQRLGVAAGADKKVAEYAAEDCKRFGDYLGG